MLLPEVYSPKAHEEGVIRRDIIVNKPLISLFSPLGQALGVLKGMSFKDTIQQHYQAC